MKQRRTMGLFALGAAGGAVLAACGSGGSSSTKSSASFGAAVHSVVNPSSHKGGTIVYDNSSGPDSTDAGNTYYSFNLNFTRLYATPLTTYKSCPGACGEQIVPALATSLGGKPQQQSLDLPHQVRGEVRGRPAGHLGRHQVRGRAHLRQERAADRPELFPRPAGRERGVARACSRTRRTCTR